MEESKYTVSIQYFWYFTLTRTTGGSLHVLSKRRSHAEAWQGPPGEAMFYGGLSPGHQML